MIGNQFPVFLRNCSMTSSTIARATKRLHFISSLHTPRFHEGKAKSSITASRCFSANSTYSIFASQKAGIPSVLHLEFHLSCSR